MTLNTVTTQEQEMINYIEQQLKNSPTIQVAINHHLISLDYALSAHNIYMYLSVQLGNTATVLNKISLPIKVDPEILAYDTINKVQYRINKRLNKLAELSNDMLDLEQTIIDNNK